MLNCHADLVRTEEREREREREREVWKCLLFSSSRAVEHFNASRAPSMFMQPDLSQVKIVGTGTQVDVACMCSSTGFFAVEMRKPPAPVIQGAIELTVSNNLLCTMTLSACRCLQTRDMFIRLQLGSSRITLMLPRLISHNP
jgi:hypothetical protein